MVHEVPASEWMKKAGYLQWSYLIYEDITKWTAREIRDFIHEVDDMITTLPPIFITLSNQTNCISISLLLKDQPDLMHHVQVFSTSLKEYKNGKDLVLTAWNVGVTEFPTEWFEWTRKMLHSIGEINNNLSIIEALSSSLNPQRL